MTGVVIGTRSTGARLVLPSPSGDSKHVLIGGQTGGGKSMIVKAFVGGLAHRPDVAIIGLDPKRTALNAWAPRLTVLAKSIRECTQVLIQVWQEVQRRILVMDAAGVNEWTPDLGGPFLSLVIDELVELIALDPVLFADALITTAAMMPSTPAFESETKTLRTALQTAGTSQKGQGAFLTSLARLCRSSGVQIVAATQHPDASVVDTQFRSNMGVRVMMRVGSDEAVSVILGNGQEGGVTPDSIPASEQGGCWVVGIEPRPVRGRGFLVEPHMECTQAAATTHLRWPSATVFPAALPAVDNAASVTSIDRAPEPVSKPRVMFLNGGVS